MVNPMDRSKAEYAFDRVTAELQAMERCISDSAIPLVNWRRKRRRNLPAHNEVETFQAFMSFMRLRLTQIDAALEGILLEEDLSILKQKDRVDSFASAQGEVSVELVVHGLCKGRNLRLRNVFVNAGDDSAVARNPFAGLSVVVPAAVSFANEGCDVWKDAERLDADVHGDSVNDDFDPLKDAAGIHCSSSLVGGGHDDSTPPCSVCTCHATKEEPTSEDAAANGGCSRDGKDVA